LRAGGDDYLAKPYSFSELLARSEVLARPRPCPEETVYRVADLELDRLTRRVMRGDHEIVLQAREFRLLEYLIKHAGQTLTRTMLLEHVWDYHFDPQTNVIEVHISRLRSKIDKGHNKACCIQFAAKATCFATNADHQRESLRNVVKGNSEATPPEPLNYSHTRCLRDYPNTRG
jgi:DNA-binding response OmpR family regulator